LEALSKMEPQPRESLLRDFAREIPQELRNRLADNPNMSPKPIRAQLRELLGSATVSDEVFRKADKLDHFYRLLSMIDTSRQDDASSRYALFKRIVETVAELNRSQVMDKLPDLASLMADLGPDTCIAETCRSIVQVGRSWS
jgi:5'-deoxynucleotidase YfbR-like HD superfamily hydrolase